jgi:hypothetical protein
MTQLHLFPPAGGPSTPLPDKTRSEVTNLVASLLIAVITASAQNQQPQRKNSHEQDSKRTS